MGKAAGVDIVYNTLPPSGVSSAGYWDQVAESTESALAGHQKEEKRVRLVILRFLILFNRLPTLHQLLNQTTYGTREKGRLRHRGYST